MKEIKFRAWADGKMHYYEDDMYWFFGNYGYWSLNTSGDDGIICDSLESDDPVLMQYTGLKDKNGKEIYEGDILQTVSRDGVRLSKFKIVWVDLLGRFGKIREDGTEYDIDFYSESGKEIIGNIYENPELLQK